MPDKDAFLELAAEQHGDRFTALPDTEKQDLYERYAEKMDTFGDPEIALTAALGSYNFDSMMEGELETVQFVSVGVNGPRPFGDEDALFVYGVVNLEERTDGRVVIIVNESDVSEPLDSLAEMFAPYEPIEAELSIREADVVDGPHPASSGYVAEIPTGASESPFETTETDIGSQSLSEYVDGHVPTVEIADVGSVMSTMDGDYSADFGLDFFKIENAYVADARISEAAGRYTFQDSSFMEPEELDSSVRGEDEEIGLGSWADPSVATFGRESAGDVFGSITPSDDGQLELRLYGIDGVSIQPIKQDVSSTDTSDGSASASGDTIDDTTI